MKLSASYNVFDGEELLEKSIFSIRDSVDFISVVYQTKSNFGNSCSPDLENVLYDLRDKKLVQELVKYTPKLNLKPHTNELIKRNIGLNLAKQKLCTHQMSIDADEFYINRQFKNLIRIMDDNDYDASYCEMLTYFKKPIYQVRPFNTYHVPVIYKVKPNSQYTSNYPCPVSVDSTRSLSLVDNPLVLARDEMEMHHMSYVRRDIRSKINNSTSRHNFTDVAGFFDMFDKYSLGETFFTTHPPGTETTVEVDNIFGVTAL